MVQQNWTVPILLSLYQVLSFSLGQLQIWLRLLQNMATKCVASQGDYLLFQSLLNHRYKNFVILDCAVRKQATRLKRKQERNS